MADVDGCWADAGPWHIRSAYGRCDKRPCSPFGLCAEHYWALVGHDAPGPGGVADFPTSDELGGQREPEGTDRGGGEDDRAARRADRQDPDGVAVSHRPDGEPGRQGDA